MQKKQLLFKIKGMNKDSANSSIYAEKDYNNKESMGTISTAYNLYNIRVAPTDDNTFGCLVNEKGNTKIDLKGDMLGIPLGICSVNNIAIIFTHLEEHIYNTTTSNYDLIKTDYIYKIELTTVNNIDTFYKCIIYKGDLNFNVLNPIESFLYWETTEIIKCYWIDGINSPRVLNLNKAYDYKVLENGVEVTKYIDANIFNFTTKIPTYSSSIVNTKHSGGTFREGIIQYGYTVFYKNGKESSFFYLSPLHYISFKDRGASPEESVSISFDIKINDLKTDAEYLRIYSIHRTSIDATATTRIVQDIELTDKTLITFTDSGNMGELVDPTILYYIGSKEFIPKTMEYKDNTLFFGNYKITGESKEQYNKYKQRFKNINTVVETYRNTTVDLGKNGTFYPYEINLKENSFMQHEEYRLGIMLLDKFGNWSSPYFITDYYVKNAIHNKNRHKSMVLPNNNWNTPNYSLNALELTFGEYQDRDIIPDLIKDGYIAIKPIIVFPEQSERNIICQGVVNPTVYKVKDRADNAPFAQSSWVFRPYYKSAQNNYRTLSQFDFSDNSDITQLYSSEIGSVIDTTDKYGLLPPFIKFGESEKEFYESFNNSFCVDQSILTLNSPDIEFDETIANLTLNNSRYEIIGIIPITSNRSNIDIATDTAPVDPDLKGFYTEIKELTNTDFNAYLGLSTMNYWIDSSVKTDNSTTKRKLAFTHSYFNRSGSLSNSTATSVNSATYANLKYKKIFNYRYSYNTIYTPELLSIDDEENYGEIDGITYFNSNEISKTLVDTNVYYGNINTIVTASSNIKEHLGKSEFPIYAGFTGDINVAGYDELDSAQYNSYPKLITNTNMLQKLSVPTSVSYKSTPHITFKLKNVFKEIYGAPYKPKLPNLYNKSTDNLFKPFPLAINSTVKAHTFFWDNNYNGTYTYSNDDLYEYENIEYGYLWLVNLIRTGNNTKFGGTSDYALQNNRWVSAGDMVYIKNEPEITLTYTKGDTYYQRYDCLKTYPFSPDSQNQPTELLSFMCSSRVNIDGKYDRNRIQSNYYNVSPLNFNLLNSVYSQKDNFFTYRIMDLSSTVNVFPNSITWTKAKNIASKIDTWTNITLASSLDLDGDKGSISSLNKYNNDIFAFQDTGISQILFNSRTQLNPTNGVPIEIANSGKVDGKVYISDNVGCTNKWTIKNTQYGLFFIDSLSKGMYILNTKGLVNLSDTKGFHSWTNKNIINTNSWTIDSDSYITNYDKINGDIFITNMKDKICLAFNEQTQLFSSFYSYYKSPYIFSIKDKVLSLNTIDSSNLGKETLLWEQYIGDYNTFYNSIEPFKINVLASGDGVNDKLFTTIEYRADFFSKSNNGEYTEYMPKQSFTELSIKNEYQNSIKQLKDILNHNSILKKMNRIWRIQLPRNGTSRDRFRNPWINIELINDGFSKTKAKIHDLIVEYYQ